MSISALLKSRGGGVVLPAPLLKLFSRNVTLPVVPDLVMLISFAPMLSVTSVNAAAPETTTASPGSLIWTPAGRISVLAAVPAELIRRISMSVLWLEPPKSTGPTVLPFRASANV